MKLYLRPSIEEVDPGTGIGRVVLAQHRYLPALEVEIVDSPERAGVIACHTQAFGLPRVDVLHTHGLYWSGDPGSGKYVRWHHEANRRIVEAARQAREITVPSEWVAMPFRRDMRLSPAVIGHGIEPDEWQPGENRGYVLWNKNRPNDVCDPLPPWELAAKGVRVLATFEPDGRPRPDSLTVTGRLPFERMKQVIRSADVYLATTKETFGVGTLEAMASGVPVLGYAWGGTADLVQHQINGYLVEPGDTAGLLEGLAWIRAHRQALSEAAIETAKAYSWDRVMEQYRAVYEQAAAPEPSGVAVVIPCYNYGRYALEAIDSVCAQNDPVDEIVVVDDGSTDGSPKTLFEHYGNHPRVRIVSQPNLGVAAARNNGIALTQQPFIICLDADDRLDPAYVETCRRAMLADRSLGIAYTGLGFLNDDRSVNPALGWPTEFDWERQAALGVPPSSCIPSAAMFRRAMWERAGGYRQAYAPGEDTEFWTRGLSVGFTARKVSDECLFHYRAHAGSASRTKKYKEIDAWLPWMQDKRYPLAAPTRFAPVVRSYSEPLVSVIIPVGPGHAQYLPGAIESLLGQTLREWEAIVVNDQGDGETLAAELRPYPFVELIEDPDGSGPHGAGAARNAGLQAARAPLVLFLDADDYLLPTALQDMLAAWKGSGGRYVYTDWVANGETHATPEYDPALLLESLPHAVTALLTREQAELVGGFDQDLPAWEDWDFFLKCAVNGIHGVRLDKPLLVYRTGSGRRRQEAARQKKQLFDQIRNRYREYYTGERPMSKCCGGSKAAQTLIEAKAHLEQSAPVAAPQQTAEGGPVRVEYFGVRKGSVTYFGKQGRRYRFGNNPIDKFADVHPDDLETILRAGDFRIVPPPAPVPSEPAGFVPDPAPEPVQAEPEPEPVSEGVSAETPSPEPDPVPERAPAEARQAEPKAPARKKSKRSRK